MEPTTTPQSPPAGPPSVGQGLVEYVRANRQSAGVGLLALAAVFLALAGFFALKAFRSPVADAPPAETEKEKADPLGKSDAKPPTETEAQLARQAQYNLAWLGFLAAAMVAGAGGSVYMARIPAATAEEQRSEARVLLLAVGGLLGLLLIVVGGVYFYQWSESLTNWLSKGESREAKWVLIPLLMVVAGAGLVFVALQPARAEERNSPKVRRLVYGSNLALTTLLMLVAVVVANVVFARKVPNRLDTTATGFYAISDATRNLLSRLSEPVNAYAVIPAEGGGREANDIRQLLLACEDASGGKFKVKFLSEVADKTELAALDRKYARFDTVRNQRLMTSENEQAGAVLLTVGADETRHAVIPAREFTTTEGQGRNREPVFVGESRLFKEIAFLADSEVRPVVYFTQGHGELAIDPGAARGPAADRAATRLRTYLDNRYLTVRPLELTAANPAVPEDAAVVVVADPTSKLTDVAVAALRKYATNPAKKGKLIVLAGVNAGADRKMVSTGLDPLLADLGTRLGTRFVYTLPSREMPYADMVEAGFSVGALANPGFEALVKAYPLLRLVEAREVEPLTENPGLRATELLLTTGPTWTEELDLDPTQLSTVVDEMRSTAKAQQARGLSRSPRPLGVTVSEGETNRAVVVGCSFFVTDAAAQHRLFQAQSRATFALIGTSIDWLREMPSVDAAEIESKKYSEYTFPNPSTVDDTRLKTLPLVIAFVLVAGVGAGVWVVRRK